MNKRVALYLAISYGIAILMALILNAFNLYGAEAEGIRSIIGMGILALLVMPAPAFATLVVERFQIKQMLDRYDLRFSSIRWKRLLFYLISMAIFIPVILLSLTYLLGDVLGITLVGELADSTEKLLANLEKFVGAENSKDANIPFEGNPLLTLLPLSIVAGIIAGFTVNGLVGMGEELGWRGFLMNEWEKYGWHQMNWMTGIVWGLWHAPIIFLGHNYPGHPYLGSLMMVVLAIPMSYLFAYARKKSQSVYAPAILHGAFNGFAPALALFVMGNHPLLGGIVGLMGALSILLSYGLIRLLEKLIFSE